MRVTILTVLLWACVTNANAQIELVTSIPIQADQIATSESFAYVAAGNTLTVFDIASPTTPIQLGTVDVPDRIYGMSVKANRAYLATGLEGLHVVEITRNESSSVTIVGLYPTPGQAVDVALIGTHAVISNLMTGLEIVNLQAPQNPIYVATVETPGYQRAVRSSGNLAYVIDQPSGIHSFDLSDPTAPVSVGLHPAGRVPARNVTVQDTRAYVVYQQTGLIEIVDITSPTNPKLLGHYEATGQPEMVAADQTSIVIPKRDDGIEIVNLVDPTAPTVTATYDTSGTARDIAIHGDYLLVADSKSVEILRWR